MDKIFPSNIFSRRKFLGGLCCAVIAAGFAPAGAFGAEAKKPLVLYFSESGNTQKIAEEIHKLVGGEILRIETAKPYPANYDELTAYAKKEIQANARPEIKTAVPDMSQFSMIFLGSPNWWSTIPMPIHTFFDKADVKGMTIAPFITHGGGGFGHTIEDIKKMLPGCKVLKGLSISGSSAGSPASAREVRAWLEGMGLTAK